MGMGSGHLHYSRTLQGRLPALAQPLPLCVTGHQPSEAQLALSGFSAHLRCSLPQTLHPFHGTPHQETWVPIWLHLTELRQESTAAATGLAHCEREQSLQTALHCSLAPLLSQQPGGRQKERGQVKCCFSHSWGN